MQYVISPGNVGCKEVSPIHYQLTKYIFISIDPRMAWVPSFCKISNARSQRWIWWFLELPRNEGDHYWQRQDRNDSRSSGYSMGRPRSIGLRLEKTWLRCTYSWAHPRVRRTAVWRKILYQSRQCHRRGSSKVLIKMGSYIMHTVLAPYHTTRSAPTQHWTAPWYQALYWWLSRVMISSSSITW